ncbi:transporter substrate-binding domain-containing protein [Desulfovibrio sp. Huiquan2017]|uniref:substrate-binding periplasmic protein n=1 Tax=Desulfovibrio sp. Huiquan2017 TaxID=2816861 RepID=UPI001A910EA2
MINAAFRLGRAFSHAQVCRFPRFDASFLLCFVFCLLWAAPGMAREPYRIGFAQNARIHQEARTRLEAVYKRAGLPVEFVPLPQKRSLLLAVDGLLDGDVGRIPGLEETYPSLVRVDVKLLDLTGAAYVVRGQDFGDYRVALLDSLRVGAVRGVLWAEKLMGDRPMEKVNNYETLFDMLLAGRIDLALGSRSSAEGVLRDDRARYGSIRMMVPAAYQTPFYHYVNRKNADIVPLLEKALRELHAEGGWHDDERAAETQATP